MNTTHKLAVVAACLIVAIAPSLATGSAFRQNEAIAGTEQPQLESVDRIYQQVSPSVVTVYAEGSQGSGVVVDARGYIITNAHVVTSDRQTIRMSDGQEYPTETIATDPDLDLALIWIPQPGLSLPALKWQDDFTQAKVGEQAIALGTPLGDEGFVTSGLVNFVDEEIVKTNVMLRPGNSGGALINTQGQLIGINYAVDARDERIGFAIPATVVKRWIEEMAK